MTRKLRERDPKNDDNEDLRLDRAAAGASVIGAPEATALDEPGEVEEPIRRPRISEEIVNRLERAIREGDYEVGGHLPSERDLMKRYGVGRPAVREALYRLQRSGLVEIKSGSRPRVTEPSARVVLDELSAAARYFLEQPAGMRHFQSLRQLFEVALVREAALHASKVELQRMKQALDANRRAIGKRDEFIQTDIAFHYTLATRTLNPVITAIHDAMGQWLSEQRQVALMRPDIEPVSHSQHQEIYEAVASGDPDEAERTMRAHLDLVAKNYWIGKGA